MYDYDNPFPDAPGQSDVLGRALRRKREWEDEEVDDLDLTPMTITRDPSSGGSYTTRRKKVWRDNQRAGQRSAAKDRHRPTFSYIVVQPAPYFYRHYQPTWRFAEPDPLVAAYIRERGGAPLGMRLEEMCMMLPCDAAQMAHLQYFDRAPLERPDCHGEAYSEALRLVAHLLTLPDPLQFPHAEDLSSVQFRPGKYPGNEYRNLGFKSRAEANPAALVDAELAWAQLLSGEYVPPHTVRLGGRGKLVMKSKEATLQAGIPKGRLILMLSQRDLLLLGNVETRLTTAYKESCYPISVGMGWYGGNVTEFMERLIPLEKFFCMDAEKYDASLDPWLVRDSLDILRRQFEDGAAQRYDKYWEFVAESLLSAPIARDDGWIMTKDVGTTSGHSFNTLLQSVATLIMGYAALFNLLEPTDWGRLWVEAELESLGDDNLTALPEWLSWITARAYGQSVRDMTGINWLGDKSFGTTTLEDDDRIERQADEAGCFQGVQYLGKYFRRSTILDQGEEVEVILPYRPMAETVARLYYPERATREPGRTYLRALGNLLDNYANPLAAAWLNGLLDWLEARIELLPQEWSSDTVQDAARDYTSARVVVPKPRRWSYEEWLILTLSPREAVDDMYMLAE